MGFCRLVEHRTIIQVYVTPHHSLVSSSLDLRPATRGLALAAASLTALEVSLASMYTCMCGNCHQLPFQAAVVVRGANISSSGRKLLDTVTRCGMVWYDSWTLSPGLGDSG